MKSGFRKEEVLVERGRVEGQGRGSAGEKEAVLRFGDWGPAEGEGAGQNRHQESLVAGGVQNGWRRQ